MAEETKTEKKNGGALGTVLSVLKLEPLREILHNVGGRKAGLSAFAIFVIWKIVEGAKYHISLGLGLALLGIGVAAAGGAVAIAWEKKKGKENA